MIVIATNNLHKIREFREMLAKIKGLDVLSLKNFPDFKELPEEGATFEDNARIKAVHAAKSLNVWALGDDSGLVVPALNGEPGVHSKRYAGPTSTDKDNRKKLLEKMRGMESEKRYAYFHCTLVLASPEGVVKTVFANVEGHIIHEEKGGSGFGYDSLFIKHDYDKTFAELEESLKNKISHRRKALDKMLPSLESKLSKL